MNSFWATVIEEITNGMKYLVEDADGNKSVHE